MKTTDNEFLQKVQERIANIAIGPSTLRNQGPKGTIRTAREFLYGLDLEELRSITEDEFSNWLNIQTKEMSNRFPGEARGNWGAARKAVNVFLENAFYDRLLSDRYNLLSLEEWLEIPLDSNVVGNLYDDSNEYGISCPINKFTIRGLEPIPSQEYQDCATEVAMQKYKGMARIYLDLYYWKKPKRKKSVISISHSI